jgi:hypothetical protein
MRIKITMKDQVENKLTGYRYTITSANDIEYTLELIKPEGFINHYNALETLTVTKENLLRFYRYIN